MKKILIVEDDVIICEGLKVFLESLEFFAQCVMDIDSARELLEESSFDLIILDINLPGGSGTELCSEIRKRSEMPVIFLTANDTEENMIEGFRCGCDDYIAKPFSVELLGERIKAVLRRSGNAHEKNLFEYKDILVDFEKMQVFVRKIPIKLSATEYKLLELLIKNRGQVLTRSIILEKIWDCNENYVDENTLNVHIKRLRKKIEKDSKNPEYIITVFGIGYTFGE